MKNKKLFFLVSFAFIWVTWISDGFPLEKATHQALNLNIAKGEINGFSLNSYLTNTLGFKDGAAEPLSGYSELFKKKMEQRVRDWVAEGGITEDEPDGLLRTFVGMGRSNNHFHNPLKPWDHAGLNAGPYSGQSSILWAQNSNQNPGGQWSWQDARRYFYDGLTAIDKSARDSAFAKTFKSLGQLMHLVEDASVPAHTRNDIHIFYNYEKWIEKIQNGKDGSQRLNDLIAVPTPFDKTILNRPANPLAPIAWIIDTDRYKYDGSNREVTFGNAIGIAEFTNANFFSEDTISNDEFPNPAIPSLPTAIYPIADPRDRNRTVARQYYIHDGFDEVTSYKLALVSFLKRDLDEYHVLEQPDYSLDDGVYNDYASMLLPRAVAYSAGLLEYFFRGNLQVTSVPISYKGDLSFLRLKIKNMTPDEAMTNGAFVLTYRYTPAGGPADGSGDIFGQAWGIDGAAVVPCIELKGASKKADGTMEWGEMVVDFMIYPALPKKDYDSIRFTLAFQGALGKEKGVAVIGKTFTLGQVVFDEEWDKYQDSEGKLPGNYPWGHTGLNILGQNYDNGSTGNVIVGDTLVKDSIRFAGKGTARINQSIVSNLCCNEQFRPKEGFPILVTPNTYVMFKIDAMSINAIPYADPGYTRQWQGLWLYFDRGLTLEYSTADQYLLDDEKTAAYLFDFGVLTLSNIYQLFGVYGISIPEGSFYLQGIDFVQQLIDLDLKDPANIEYHQHMEVDFIQIIEGNEQ